MSPEATRKRLEISRPDNSERPNIVLRQRAILGSDLRNPPKQSSFLPPKGYIAICNTRRPYGQVKALTSKTVKHAGVSALTIIVTSTRVIARRCVWCAGMTKWTDGLGIALRFWFAELLSREMTGLS